MANTRFGWHSGAVKCKDIEVLGDMSILGDLSFGDASTDTLTVNGAATFLASTQFSEAMTVGVDGTGYDVTLYGATASSYLLWDESADKLKVVGVLDIEDTGVGGAALGSVIKKQLVAGEAYTATTAGLMIKNYGEATATIPNGEFCAVYASVKGLHTDPGNNTSIISAHVHASNTTTVHAGLWIYGDMTNGVKMSGSTLTSAIDISEATAVTNLVALPAAGTAPVAVGEGAVGSQKASIKVKYGATTGYLVIYDGVAAS